MQPIALALDAGERAGFGAKPTIAAWLFAPPDLKPNEAQVLAVCLHGGGYSKSYFHAEAPGYGNYSMARHLAERGVIAATIDWLGSGESSKPDDADILSAELLGQAHHAAVLALRDRLARGTLAPSLPPISRLRVVGIGHSMGGMLTIVQQAEQRTFDQIAILGWSNKGLAIDPAKLKSEAIEQGKYVLSSAALRRSFHLDDVPPDVLACDAERNVVPVATALAKQAMSRQSMPERAAAIDAPVFIAFGEHDTSTAPREEVSAYSRSGDVTFFLLPGSAHCHNFAGTREVLWDRILIWLQETRPSS